MRSYTTIYIEVDPSECSYRKVSHRRGPPQDSVVEYVGNSHLPIGIGDCADYGASTWTSPALTASNHPAPVQSAKLAS